MIGSLRGRLVAIDPPVILLDVQGVGFELQMPLSDLSELPPVGGDLSVATQLVSREDELSLYGFIKPADRAWFRELVRVPGIGPKLALNIVAQSGVAEFTEQVEARRRKGLDPPAGHRSQNRQPPHRGTAGTAGSGPGAGCIQRREPCAQGPGRTGLYPR